MQMELDFGMCTLADYDEDGFAQIQTDSPGINGSEGTQAAETLLPHGLYARPLDPDKGPNGDLGLGAPALVITHGDRRYVLPLGDPRDVNESKVPRLKKGGKMLAGGAGDHRSFFLIDGLDPNGSQAAGSIMISASYTKAGAKKSLGLSFNVRDAGSEDITLVHGDGARVTVGASGTTIAAPNGKHYVEVSTSGNVLAGSCKVQGALTVGEQTAARQVALGPELVAILSELIAVIVPIVGVSGAGAPAAALLPRLSTILAKHLKAT